MFLYIIRCGKEEYQPVKIGISSNPKKRMKMLQVGNPYKLKVIYKIPMRDREHAVKVESSLHKKYRKHWIRGEWFKGVVLKEIKFKKLY